MMMDNDALTPNDRDWRLLDRYLAGEATETEARDVGHWVAADPRHALVLDTMRGVRQAQREPNVGRMWERVEREMGAPQMHRRFSMVMRARRRWIPMAGVAVAAVIVGVLLLKPTPHAPGARRPAPMREVTTAAGQRAQVQLGDGSTVTLGVKSRLRFADDFGANSRDLYLDGEAYFVVAHDITRPFIVHAAGTKTVDVGTAFVLRAYADDDAVRVVVAKGSVTFGGDQVNAPAPIVLTPGQMGRLVKDTPMPVVRLVDPLAYTSWMTGRLVFDNAPLTHVVTELGRWYDADVRLGDPSLALMPYTASFAHASFAETLKALTTVLNLRAERRGTTVILYRR